MSQPNDNFFKLTVEQLLEGIQIIDQDFRYVYINDVAARQGKFKKEEYLGKTMMQMYPGIENTDFFIVLKEALQNTKRARMQNQFVYPDGVTKCWFELLFEPHPMGVLIRSFDITDRKSLEVQYEHSQKIEAIGRLAGGIAHDFNNKLAIMLLYCEMAMEHADTDVVMKKYLDYILSAVKDSGALTKQLLAFGRKQVLDLKVITMNEVIEKMQDSLQRIIGENINLKFHLAENLAHIRVDPAQMDQVILNLCINARDAMNNGTGNLTIETSNVNLDKAYCELHPEVVPGEYVMLSISDNGSGMSEEIRSRIFEPFFTTKKVGKGSGLGLASVHGIVKQSRGHIWVYSEVNVGSSFKLYFPVTTDKREMPVVEPKQNEITGNENILLVENDLLLREAFVEMLQRSGYRVFSALTAEEAYDIYLKEKNNIDILLTDVILPRKSGKDLAAELKLSNPDMKVIFMSGYTENSIVHNGVLDQGFILLEKPVTSQKLLTTLRHVLEGKLVKGRA